jgi:multidrug efflux pump subunit AcrB
MKWLLSQSHAILAFYLLTILAGIFSYVTMPLNLFPDVNRPVIPVIVQWPGAASDDVAREVTHPIEVRLSAIDGVTKVTSTSRDEVSAVRVEFDYAIPIDDAASAVISELPRVTGQLPSGARAPLIFKVTEAARPAVILAVSAADGYDLDLGQIRRIAGNPLRDAILRIDEIAEAEVFGGDQRQVAVDLDRNKLEAYGLSAAQVAAALEQSNLSFPAGLIHRDGMRFLLTAKRLAVLPNDLGEVLVPLPGGNHVRVSDLGRVSWGTADPTSLFRGNMKPAVALSILRGEKGTASATIASLMAALPALRQQFPMLSLSVADTQGRLIHQTVDNMLNALRDAVIMTLAVILLFLGNSRAAFITALSIPFTYLITFLVLRLIGFEFDMVTLTAIIIAVGLLADDAIVVIENIERRMRETGEAGLKAAVNGTSEILRADASGTLTTIAVLVPIMFVGGFSQQILRPLTVTLSVALAASLLVSVTIIPLMVPWLMRGEDQWDPLGWLLRPFDRFFISPVKRLYVGMVTLALRWPVSVVVFFALLFAASLPQMKTLGRELMPLMDTGVIKVSFEAEPDSDTARMTEIAERIEAALRAEVPADWILNVATIIGAEPGVKSMGGDQVFQKGAISINLVNRFERNRSIYDIEAGLRRRVHQIPGLVHANVLEFGATPVSSIRATVDVMITGADPLVLDRLGDEVLARLQNVRGLTGLERSWQGKGARLNLNIDQVQARLYGITAQEIAAQVAAQVKGIPGGTLRVPSENAIPVWVRLTPHQRSDPESIAALPIRIHDGQFVPLMALAKPQFISAPTEETHEQMLPTINVLGYRGDIDLIHLHENVVDALNGLQLPRGYTLSYEGEYKQSLESFQRMFRALGIGLALLFLMLIITFRSFLDPLAVFASLPLAVIGAAWGLMIAGKHGSLPAFMGLILLMGIAVNNGILLIDFARRAQERGAELKEALLQAVELRTRPILMTAGAAAVGMVPVAMEWAVGLERLSPLAIVAIGGMIVGTFLTLLVVPVLYYLLESGRMRFERWRGPGKRLDRQRLQSNESREA